MADVLTPEQRRHNMQRVRGRDTQPEMLLRRSLHSRGFRYRLHRRGLPGKPDLVFPKHCAVIFVHGCFWHRHERCRYVTTPSTRAEFWQGKFQANVARDIAVRESLLEEGWRVATIWECALRRRAQVATVADQISTWLLTETDTLELGEREISAAARIER